MGNRENCGMGFGTRAIAETRVRSENVEPTIAMRA